MKNQVQAAILKKYNRLPMAVPLPDFGCFENI